jgi:hypothetical protein
LRIVVYLNRQDIVATIAARRATPATAVNPDAGVEPDPRPPTG